MTFRSKREQMGNREIVSWFVRPGYNNNNDNNDKISRREGSFASIATRYQVLTRRNFASNSRDLLARPDNWSRPAVNQSSSGPPPIPAPESNPSFRKFELASPLSLKFCHLILIRREEVFSFLVRLFFPPHSSFLFPCREQFLIRIFDKDNESAWI